MKIPVPAMICSCSWKDVVALNSTTRTCIKDGHDHSSQHLLLQQGFKLQMVDPTAYHCFCEYAARRRAKGGGGGGWGGGFKVSRYDFWEGAGGTPGQQV